MLTDDDIAEIRSGVGPFEAAIERVRNDKRLSAEGKQGEMGRLIALERRRRQGIAQAARDRAAAQRTALERKLFRLPSGADASDTVSYRDALDRAEAITDPAELAQLINRAVGTGDAALARAGLARSYQQYNASRRNNEDVANRWREAAAPYIEAAGESERAALTELDKLDTATSHPDRGMRESMITTIHAPRELSHLQDHQIDAMAAGELPNTIPLPVSDRHPVDEWMRSRPDQGSL